MQYSGAAEGRRLPMVLEIVVGPVDRGACIKDLSQFPKENEYLYLPLSFVSPDGTPRVTISADGLGVRVIPVRINVNLSARTVEQLLEQKRRMHCAAFRFLVSELNIELARLTNEPEGSAEARLADERSKNQGDDYTVDGLCKRILEQFAAVLEKHEQREDWQYADDTIFQGLVTEMLDGRRWAVSKLRHWLEDHTTSISFVMGYSLRGANRRFTAYLTRVLNAKDTVEGRQEAALEVCRARGLLQEATDAGKQHPSPLVVAAADGAAAADIRLLIAAGFPVNGAEGKPSAAAKKAAKYGHVDVLGALLQAKAAVNASIKVLCNQSLWDCSATEFRGVYLTRTVLFCGDSLTLGAAPWCP
jgi:hypothetical protein